MLIVSWFSAPEGQFLILTKTQLNSYLSDGAELTDALWVIQGHLEAQWSIQDGSQTQSCHTVNVPLDT